MINNKTIFKPIFILGSGRSGTTVFYNCLSLHPEVCWFSNFSNRFVSINQLPFMHRMLDLPFVGNMAKQNIISRRNSFIRPAEGANIYNYYGFKSNIKSTENNLNVETEKRLKNVIKQHLSLTGKKRFLNKRTANIQRIRLINKMFDDAYFIHIIRDGRAVANSLLNVNFWNDMDVWWLGEKTSEWENQGRQPIELCGLHWKRNVEEILENKSIFKDRYMELRYEGFILDVRGTIEKVVDFCELSKSEIFLKLLPQTLPNMNYKWKDNLTKEQMDILEKTLQPYLDQLGYG